MAQLHRGTEGQSFSHKCKMLELLCHENMSETNGSLLSFVPSERLVTLLSTSDIVKFDYVATPGRMTTRARKRIFDWVIAVYIDILLIKFVKISYVDEQGFWIFHWYDRNVYAAHRWMYRSIGD